MKLLLRFLKPHWKLCVLTVVLLFVDVAGSLFIPTLVAEMLNAGTSGAAFQSIVTTGIQMAVISAVAGLGAIAGGYACATLTAQVAKDMRQAIYTKSLKLSVYDFRQFGTASITTRTISDVTTIQMALLSSIQMILPVPVICVLSLVLTFNLNRAIGFVLLAVVLVVLILAFFMIRSASPLFRRLQKLLDRMSTVFLENLTGVRVLLHLPEKVEGGDQAVKQTGQVFTVVHLHGLHPVHRSGNGRDRTDLFDVSYVQL